MSWRLFALVTVILVPMPFAGGTDPGGPALRVQSDPCIDRTAVPDRPKDVLVIDEGCSRSYVGITVNGTTVRVEVSLLGEMVHVVIECATPGYLPGITGEGGSRVQPYCPLFQGLA